MAAAREGSFPAVTDAATTPADRLEDLPGFPWASAYREVDGVRLAHVDEGDGPPVVMVHGEPTWGYLWRKLVAPVRDAGFRVVLPDHAGFGRSDKPHDVGWYSYDRHTALLGHLLEHLDLRGATMVVHDWGGPIGLRAAIEHRERVDRLVLLDTGLVTGRQRMTEAWQAFRAYVERTEDLPIGVLVRGGCATDPGDDVIAAYEAPYPDVASKAGARAFPLMWPLTPDAPGAAAGQRVLDALKEDDRPALLLWAEHDPIVPFAVGERLASAIGAPPPRRIEGASHFLQEDRGEELGALIAEWLSGA
jgi:haloalkane dehalogenase